MQSGENFMCINFAPETEMMHLLHRQPLSAHLHMKCELKIPGKPQGTKHCMQGRVRAQNDLDALPDICSLPAPMCVDSTL